ncbi:MAG: zf-TFIIB domain-containing protein [bacterium]|nr:zf-TFIIB domain-containing protein [bacterium]
MICPACGSELREMKTESVVVDVCDGGCGGIWFDRFELQRVDEPHEAACPVLLASEGSPHVEVDHGRRRNCPRCPDTVMMRHFFSVKQQVEVDQCPGCGGYWLDPGELALIRSEYGSEEERRVAAREYFKDIFGHELAAMRAEGSEKAERAWRIARMFRYICPSHYIPGDQPWGAF